MLRRHISVMETGEVRVDPGPDAGIWQLCASLRTTTILESDVRYSLIAPMVAHVGLTALLYVILTIARAPAIWGVGRAPDGSNPWANVEKRISANLSNQFEWPMFFYVACLLLLMLQVDTGGMPVILAWIFILGRLIHSLVQILTNNIRLRGIVFTINFLAVLELWTHLVLAMFQNG